MKFYEAFFSLNPVYLKLNHTTADQVGNIKTCLSTQSPQNCTAKGKSKQWYIILYNLKPKPFLGLNPNNILNNVEILSDRNRFAIKKNQKIPTMPIIQ